MVPNLTRLTMVSTLFAVACFCLATTAEAQNIRYRVQRSINGDLGLATITGWFETNGTLAEPPATVFENDDMVDWHLTLKYNGGTVILTPGISNFTQIGRGAIVTPDYFLADMSPGPVSGKNFSSPGNGLWSVAEGAQSSTACSPNPDCSGFEEIVVGSWRAQTFYSPPAFFLVMGEGYLFQDDFETGDTTGWTSSVP